MSDRGPGAGDGTIPTANLDARNPAGSHRVLFSQTRTGGHLKPCLYRAPVFTARSDLQIAPTARTARAAPSGVVDFHRVDRPPPGVPTQKTSPAPVSTDGARRTDNPNLADSMTPTWADVGLLLARGADSEFTADLVVRPRDSPAPSVLSWVMDDPRANVHAGPGRSRITRAGGSRVRLDHPDGRSTLFNEGTVWQVDHDQTATMFRVMSLNATGFAAHLIDQPDNAEEALGYGFPSEPVHRSTHQGRPVAVVAGDAGDGSGGVALSVDMRTGVLVRVAAADGSWGAWLENLDVRQIGGPVFRWEGPVAQPDPIAPCAPWIPAPFIDDITPGPDPEPLPADPRGRLLRVGLDELVIADGQLSPPRVGETIEVHLTFLEEPSHQGTESTQVRAFAEPIGTGTPREDHRAVLRWPTVLRGDGWTATWSAPRPAVGHVLIAGQFVILHDAAAAHWFTPTRAAVARIRVNRLTGPMPADTGSGQMPGSAWSDERSCPVGFAPDSAHHAADGAAPAIAVVLDLDLDSAEAPRARNDFEPGVLSSLGGDLWAGDRHRPILQHRRIGDSVQTEEHLLPLPVRVYSRAITPYVGTGGLWIEHNRKLWSVDIAPDRPAIHDLGGVGWGSAVTIGPHLVTSGDHLRRFDALGEIDPIALPPEVTYVGALARVDEGLLVIGREPSDDDDEDVDLGYGFTRRQADQRFHLAVYDHAGEWRVGGLFGLPAPATAIGRGAGGIWVLSTDLLLRFDEALRRTTVHRLPYAPISAGPTASGLWLSLDSQRIALGLRDPDAPDPWGLRESLGDVGPRGESRHGLVVRVDNDLHPDAPVLTDSLRPSVTVTADDTVWFSGRTLRGITVGGHIIDG